MRAAPLHLSACLLAAAAPLVAGGDRAPAAAVEGVEFPGWPAEFEGHPLVPAEPTSLDARFETDLPGRVARFRAGDEEVVIRWSPWPTRLLHPCEVCFRALGWSVTPLPIRLDAAGRPWARSRAQRGDETLVVRERVEDAMGRSWAEPTSWYWASLLGRTSGPAWAWTVARRDRW